MKVVKKIALIVLILWSAITTICCVASISMHSDMEAEYAELETKYSELKEESENVDITTIRGLAYELLFDNVYYEGVLGEKYDLNAEIDKKVEQYELNEIEEMELVAMVKVLIGRYSAFELDK